MRRRDLLALPAAAAVAVSSASLTHAAEPRGEVFVSAGSDRDRDPFTFLDATFQVKVSGKDTEGRCVIFDTIRHQKAGPPLHLHTDCDEWFLVKEGEFKFQVGAKTMRLKAGDSLLVPREMPHAFVKTSDGDARLVVMHQPAVRMEEYFRRESKERDQSVEARKRVAAEYGIRHVGPPLKAD